MSLSSFSYLPDIVYFITNGNRSMIKVGRTRNLNERVKQLRYEYKDDCLYCGGFQRITHEKAILLERQLHNEFKNYRVFGEWFGFESIKQYMINHDELFMPLEFPNNNCNYLYDIKTDTVIRRRLRNGGVYDI